MSNVISTFNHLSFAPMFFANQVPFDKLDQWENIAIHLEFELPDESDIWSLIREQQEPPHLGNVYLGEVLSMICDWCEIHGINADFDLASVYTSLTVDEVDINTLDEFLALRKVRLALETSVAAA